MPIVLCLPITILMLRNNSASISPKEERPIPCYNIALVKSAGSFMYIVSFIIAHKKTPQLRGLIFLASLRLNKCRFSLGSGSLGLS